MRVLHTFFQDFSLSKSLNVGQYEHDVRHAACGHPDTLSLWCPASVLKMLKMRWKDEMGTIMSPTATEDVRTPRYADCLHGWPANRKQRPSKCTEQKPGSTFLRCLKSLNKISFLLKLIASSRSREGKENKQSQWDKTAPLQTKAADVISGQEVCSLLVQRRLHTSLTGC